jgi:membrane fusion protein (multidrug efflux system)
LPNDTEGSVCGRGRPARNVSVGSYVKPGDLITTLDDIRVVKGDFTVPERFLGSLKPGPVDRCLGRRLSRRDFKGTVASVDTRVDPVTRAVKCRQPSCRTPMRACGPAC